MFWYIVFGQVYSCQHVKFDATLQVYLLSFNSGEKDIMGSFFNKSDYISLTKLTGTLIISEYMTQNEPNSLKIVNNIGYLNILGYCNLPA